MCQVEVSSPSLPSSTPYAGGPCGGIVPCSTPTPAVLEIVDKSSGSIISGTMPTKIVGQKIVLSVRTQPPGHAITNVQWTIPPATVKSYTQTGNKGEKIDLASADLQGVDVDFYWIDGGSKAVQVTADVDGSAQSASVTVTVLRPTMEHFTIEVSSVNVFNTGFPLDPKNPYLAAYEASPQKYGSQWDAKVKAPADGDGLIGFTQLILINRSRTSNSGKVSQLSSGGAYVLDGNEGIQYRGAQQIKANHTASLSGYIYADSPNTELKVGFQSYSVDESFELYLMYKPAGTDSIWVTLGKGTWGYAGQATRKGTPASTTNEWKRGPKVPMKKSDGVDSVEIPQWNDQYCNIANKGFI
jgi:hypothetical protein